MKGALPPRQTHIHTPLNRVQEHPLPTQITSSVQRAAWVVTSDYTAQRANRHRLHRQR